jgi:hypothetical protein
MSLANVHSAPNTSDKITLEHELKNRFRSEQYRIEQPYMQITAEGYTISAADGSESYTAVRPRHLFHSFFAMGLAGIAFAVTLGFSVYLTEGLKDEGVILLSVFAGFLGGMFVAYAVGNICGPIRRATVKDHAGALMMVIEPTSRYLLFNSEFAIRDAQGRTLATFKKYFWSSLFQKRWHATDFQGRYLFTATEDNLILSVLRRYLNLAKLIPMHFRFSKGGGKKFGEFRRGYSLRDKYKLNYDPAAADGWLMVAAGILLDTGEKR